MGVIDAPQWLLPAFVRSVHAVGGTADHDEVERTAESLLERWNAPERRFHNLRHLVAVIARVDELTEETHSPDLVRLAAWYHGAVFDAAATTAAQMRGGEDESASAEVAYRELTALGVPEKAADHVRHLVQCLDRHQADLADPDTAVLCDADLAMLAVEPQRYRTYVEDLRAEYAHVPVRDFLEARQLILSKLLARRKLFVSPLSEGWEEPARQNLAAELARVTKELARVEPAAGTTTDPAGTVSGSAATTSGVGTAPLS